MYGINGSLLNWFSTYLMGRRQRVVIESSSSDWLPVVSGVPQGSIFRSFLFLLYIDDLPSIVSPESTLALFADDSKCFRSIKTLDDCLEFQDDVSAIKSWGDSWGMQFNSSKCKILHITTVPDKIVETLYNTLPSLQCCFDNWAQKLALKQHCEERVSCESFRSV